MDHDKQTEAKNATTIERVVSDRLLKQERLLMDESRKLRNLQERIVKIDQDVFSDKPE